MRQHWLPCRAAGDPRVVWCRNSTSWIPTTDFRRHER